jgi:hypothetical protein
VGVFDDDWWFAIGGDMVTGEIELEHEGEPFDVIFDFGAEADVGVVGVFRW